MLLGLPYGKFAEVEYRGGQHRGGVALADAVDEMVEVTDAAGRDYRYGNTVGDGLRQRQVEAALSERTGMSGLEEKAARKRDT